MKTNFDFILKEHRRKFGLMTLNFSKGKIRQVNRLLGRGMLVIFLLAVVPSFFIAHYTNNAFWILTIGILYLFYFVVEWFWINPYGINKFSNSNLKFSIKSWVDEDRIQDRAKTMSKSYGVDEVKELRNVAIKRLEQLKGLNFKKFEIIVLSIIGLFITKYISVEMLYRFASRNFYNNEMLTDGQKDSFVIQVLVFLIVIVILYHFIKHVINQKWADIKKQVKNFVKDMDDIIIEKAKQ